MLCDARHVRIGPSTLLVCERSVTDTDMLVFASAQRALVSEWPVQLHIYEHELSLKVERPAAPWTPVTFKDLRHGVFLTLFFDAADAAHGPSVAKVTVVSPSYISLTVPTAATLVGITEPTRTFEEARFDTLLASGVAVELVGFRDVASLNGREGVVRKHCPDKESWIVETDGRLFNLHAHHLRVRPFAKIVYRGECDWSTRNCLRGIVPGHVVWDWKVVPCVLLYHDKQLFPAALPRLVQQLARYGVADDAAKDLLERAYRRDGSDGIGVRRAVTL